jgi:hypothetical protein
MRDAVQRGNVNGGTTIAPTRLASRTLLSLIGVEGLRPEAGEKGEPLGAALSVTHAVSHVTCRRVPHATSR